MKKLRFKTQIMLGIVLTFLMLVVFGNYYFSQMEKFIYEKSSHEIITTSNQISAIFQDKTQSYYRFLKGIALLDKIKSPEVSAKEKINTLGVILQSKFNIYIGICLLDGKAYTNDNRIFAANSPEYAFIQQLDGQKTSNQIISQTYGIPILIHKEPLVNTDQEVIGFIFLIEEIPSLLERANSSAYLSKNVEYNIIDDNNYTFAPNIESVQQNTIKNLMLASPLYNVQAYKEAMDNNQPYCQVIGFNNSENFVCITQTKITPNLYIITSIPNKFLNLQYKEMLNLSIFTFFLVGVALSALIAYLIYIQRKHLQKNNVISTVFKSSAFYYLELSYTGKIIKTNLAFREKTEFKNSYLNSHYLHNICANISNEKILKLLGLGDSFELEILTSKDQIIHVKWLNLSPNEHTLHMIGVDFTSQKEAEQLSHNQLAQNNLQMIFDNVPIPLMLRNLDDTILMVNSALNTLTNTDCYSFIGKPFRDAIPFEDLFNLQRDLEQSFISASTITTETVIIAKDGSERYFNTTQVPLYDKYDAPSSILTVFIDITDSKNFSIILKKEINRLQQLLETSPVGVVISIDDVVHFANPYAQEISMLRVGKSTNNAILDVEIYDEIIKEVAEGKIASQREVRAIGKEGQTNYILLSAAATIFQDKPGIITWGVNINKLKKIEEELVFARDIAESATTAKSNFLANMSHEIRTPINAVLGMSHLMQQTPLTPKQKGYVDNINISAKLLLHLIDDILDFSKIEANKLDIESHPFQLDVPINMLIQTARVSAEEKDLKLNINFDKTLPKYVNGDSTLICQILQTVLSNAIKFTHTGEIEINIKNEKIENNFASITFEVQDTGIGMTEQQRKEAFNSFTQVDTSTTRKYGGTGLGLSICKQLIKLMDGTIKITSEKGKGTTFAFNLNLEISEAPELETTQKLSTSALKGCKLLLAEDNFINQQIALEILNNVDISVDIANNGVEALQMALENEYEFILIDIKMPEMDGLEATYEMRKHDKLKNIPIIAMTAHAMKEDKEKALKAGMDEYVTKPIDPNLLYNTLLRWVSPNSTENEVSTNAPLPNNTDFSINIRGFDYNSAIQRLMGNEKLLLNLLANFHTNFATYPDTSRHMLNLDIIHDENQRPNITEESIRLAHTLKSVAGNLSMTDIQNKAAEIEVMLNSDSATVQTIAKLINECEEFLQPVIEDISALLPNYQNETSMSEDNNVSNTEQELSPEEKESVNNAIQQTLALLEENSPDAELAFVPLLVLLETQYAPMIKKISKALDSFDFDKAKIELNELAIILK